jgi:hypothetical protein
MRRGLIIVFALSVLSCSTENVTTSTELNGKWVDIHSRTDTLTFGLFGDQESMVLGRGREMRNGVLRPKNGAGPYLYELLTSDTISLRWTLSSSSNFNDYYFRQTGDRLTIEKFFDTTTPDTILTFKKLN